MRRRLLLCALAACAAPHERSAGQAITNGSDDAGDPAVIALVDGEGDVGCTASVIEAHTAITAAHCLEGQDPRALSVFFGTSVAAGGMLVAVSAGSAEPSFDPSSLAHDVAMLTLRDAAPVAVLAVEPGPLGSALVGQTLEAVGFGTTAAGAGDAGVKHVGTAQITDVEADAITVVPDPSQPCLGDSGGPALLADGNIAGVVSNGDPACTDHAVYARADVELTSFIEPYLAATAPGTAQVGDACLYDGECATGPCLAATDDAELYFCSQTCAHDSDCPSAMRCDGGQCRYPLPSPGALGSTCTQDATCTSGTCRDGTCTQSCLAQACPSGFECTGTGLDLYCERAGGGGCACESSGGAGGAAAIAFVMFALVRRRRA